MKKLLLIILLSTGLVKTVNTYFQDCQYSQRDAGNYINQVDSQLTVNSFFKKAFGVFDNQSFNQLKTQTRTPSYSEQVKYWWQGKHNSAIPGLTGKVARTIGFPVKIIASTFDNFRKIFFNTSISFQDFFIQTERTSLVKMFSAFSSYKSQLIKVKKILDIIKENENLKIGDIKKAFHSWTQKGALADLEDALFPKEIRIFMSDQIQDRGVAGKLKNVFKQFDPLELIYRGNRVLNVDLISASNTYSKSVFNKFDPELKLAFFKQLSSKNKKILFQELNDGREAKDNQINDFLNKLQSEANPARSTETADPNISETAPLLTQEQRFGRPEEFMPSTSIGEQAENPVPIGE